MDDHAQMWEVVFAAIVGITGLAAFGLGVWIYIRNIINDELNYWFVCFLGTSLVVCTFDILNVFASGALCDCQINRPFFWGARMIFVTQVWIMIFYVFYKQILKRP